MALRRLAHREVSPRSWLAPWPRCAPSSPALTTVPAVVDFTEGSPKGPDLRCYRPPGTDAVGVELVGPGPVLVAASVNGGAGGVNDGRAAPRRPPSLDEELPRGGCVIVVP